VPERAQPFSLRVDDDQLTTRLNTSLYRTSGADGGHVDATARPVTITFDYQDSAGLRVQKIFTFEPSKYQVAFSTTVMDGDQALNPTIEMGPGVGDMAFTPTGGFFNRSYDIPPEAIYEQPDAKVQRLTQSKLATQPEHTGAFRFAGVDDHYFITIAINPGQARVNYRAVTAPGINNESPRQLLEYAIRFAKPPQRVRFFLGPKQFDVLRDVDPELVRAINFGIFAWLVIPLLSTLKWLNLYIGNWGWSIVGLTLLINLIILPLRHKSVVSMRKMQTIQPQIKAIQARYADLKMTDPAKQKMNTEVMNLYREHGVNPASGCVPMLLTFPVLFALYSLLSQATELRGAEWMLWIHDLSQQDPYYVTPIIVGITMWWQQKLTPTTVDPAQQKMMMMMPIIFTAMFVTLPSGVAIYYLVGNIFAVGQQYFTNWMIGPAPVPRPPAERRLKNAGAGRTAAADKKS
jgi:YidC/Oxa1 family membrane protein insertase